MPLVLHHGDNVLDIDDAVRDERRRFDTADTVVLDGAATSLAELAQACHTPGLFSSERLVVVNSLHARGKGSRKEAPDNEELEGILCSISAQTTVLLAEPGMAADHALARLVRQAGGQVRTHVLPKRGELPRWIQARARQAGTVIELPAAEVLADLVGANPRMLDNELTKLAVYADGESITATMVETMVGSVPQDTIFSLVDAIAAGDRALSLKLLHRQMDVSSSSPVDFAVYLIRMLARQMRILLRIRLGRQAGRSQSQMISELKLPRYYADRYFRQAQRLSLARLRDSFEQLAALEERLKTGRAEPGDGLDVLVGRLCA